MVREIRIRRLLAGSVFKLVAVGLTCTILPFMLLMGILAMFGASTITWNHQTATGVYGLLAASFFGVVLVLFLTMLLGSCIAFGLWLYSRFRPMVLLLQDDSPAAAPED